MCGFADAGVAGVDLVLPVKPGFAEGGALLDEGRHVEKARRLHQDREVEILARSELGAASGAGKGGANICLGYGDHGLSGAIPAEVHIGGSVAQALGIDVWFWRFIHAISLAAADIPDYAKVVAAQEELRVHAVVWDTALQGAVAGAAGSSSSGAADRSLDDVAQPLQSCHGFVLQGGSDILCADDIAPYCPPGKEA